MAEIITPNGTIIGLIVDPDKEKEETEANPAKKAGRPKKAAEK